MRLSTVMPYVRLSQPNPPPSVRPAIPVVELMPVGTARARAWVAASRSPNVAPGSTRAVRASGSTCTAFILLNEITRPPSHIAFPAMLWPAPKMASRSPCSAANLTAEETSSSVRQSTMRPGCRSIIPFQRARASSYWAESGVIKSPSRESFSAPTALSLTVTLPPSSVVRSGIGCSPGFD